MNIRLVGCDWAGLGWAGQTCARRRLETDGSGLFAWGPPHSDPKAVQSRAWAGGLWRTSQHQCLDPLYQATLYI